MPVDPRSYVPAYQQIADALRERIRSGELAPGQWLPSEDRLAAEFGTGKDALRDALAVLRSEGLVSTEHRRGSRVREAIVRRPVRVAAPASVVARMPTPEERREFGLDEGVPVLVVTKDGGVEVRPGDRFEIEIV